MEDNNNENKIDIEYILSHYDANVYEIPHSFDHISWKNGQTYKIRIGNIYDPSKFWVVHYEKELNAVHQYLNNFYNMRKEDYRMPREAVKRNIYCTVFTDGGYYRGIIVNIPRFTSEETKVIVFLFDFGFTNVTTVENLYFLCENMYELPRYSIRACLYGIEPAGSDVWTDQIVKKFSDITRGKVMYCFLEDKFIQQKTIYIRIGELMPFNQVKDISEVFILEKLAKVASRKSRSKKISAGKLVPKVAYPFLFPLFQEIESGLVPSTVHISEMLQSCPTSSILYKSYYSYKGVNLTD